MKTSFLGKTWNFNKHDEDTIAELKRNSDIDDIVIKILLNRGFTTAEEISSFLNAKMKNTIPDPYLLLDMEKGVDRLTKAIIKNEKLYVFGDYDVDGITSSCIIIKYLRQLGLQVEYYIPNRFSDGYGINAKAIEDIINHETSVLIVVDSGTNSIEAVDTANSAGIDVIILDHHIQLSNKLPQAIAVINPNRLDQKDIPGAHIKQLCAAGVALLFIIAIQRELKNLNFFCDKITPDITNYLDLVTLGTLCDVMEVKGINRAIIKYTLAQKSYSTGIMSLMNGFNIDTISSPEDLSFFVGPAINAAGRLSDPHIALNLLLEEHTDVSQKIADQLIALNKKRKRLEKHLLADAMLMVNQDNLAENNGICVYGDGWHGGLIGIIAGKLKDKFNKPAFVVSFGTSGIGLGSARSVPGVHLGKFFEKTNEMGITISAGGHALAGGFSIEKSKIDDFSKLINLEMKCDFVNSIDIDDTLSAMTDLSQVYKRISVIEPFGKGVEKPTFCIKRVKLSYSKKTTSGAHLMLSFSCEFSKKSFNAMVFNIESKHGLLSELEKNLGGLFDVVGTISSNDQFGSKIIVDDIRLSTDS